VSSSSEERHVERIVVAESERESYREWTNEIFKQQEQQPRSMDKSMRDAKEIYQAEKQTVFTYAKSRAEGPTVCMSEFDILRQVIVPYKRCSSKTSWV